MASCPDPSNQVISLMIEAYRLYRKELMDGGWKEYIPSKTEKWMPSMGIVLRRFAEDVIFREEGK